MSSYGTRRAVSELLSIFECQWQNGMLPQIRFMPGQEGYRPNAEDWGVTPQICGATALPTSGITQPPIIGLCAYEAWRKMDPGERREHTAHFWRISEGLDRFHAWLLAERDPWGENLVLCLHPWETGTDNSPAFDPLVEATRRFIATHGLEVDTFGRADTQHVSGSQRPTERDYYAYFGLLALFRAQEYDQRSIIQVSPFVLQDVLFNTLFAESLRSLAQLQEDLAGLPGEQAGGELRQSAAENRERGAAVAQAIRDKLWDERDGLFYSYDCRGNRLLKTPTVSSLVPLFGVASDEQARGLLARLSRPAEFWTNVPIPSTALDSPSFNALRYWSGPSWPVTNWLVLLGLRSRGSSLANELRDSTLLMIAEGVDWEKARRAAEGVLEMNSFGEEFTTPSRKQYMHAWLWDSAIVAASWPLVKEKPEPYAPGPGLPRFWEYFHPLTGEPLGAPLMSWTASLYLEMLALDGSR